MTIIKEEDLISSVEDALQYISYYHPIDFVEAMHEAYKKEINPAAKDAIGQILINSRLCAQGKRPICQDTGIISCFINIGTKVRIDSDKTLQEIVDEGCKRAYASDTNPLRKSVVSDPVGARKNTKDNTPVMLHTKFVKGDKLEVILAAKGGGSENKSKVVMLNPSDSVANWVEKVLPTMGAGWCPPGILGIGIGGTIDKAAVLAKESLMEPCDIHKLLEKGASTKEEELRLDIYKKANATAIGAQGLGGLTTVLDVKIKTAPTHAASLPVVMIPNCAATRHIHFTLDGSSKYEFKTPDLNKWPVIKTDSNNSSKKIDLDNIKKEDLKDLKSGDTLLLSGKILTGRDAAHGRLVELLKAGKPLPDGVDFTNKFIYYVGPVDAVGDEVVGPAGPTTATRMDKFTEDMLANTSLLGMIGKAERGDATCKSIAKHKAVYLMAVGGAAYLVAKAIKKAKVVAFADLGMEAIYEFEVEDMPVTVAVDSNGDSIHQTGPAFWRGKL